MKSGISEQVLADGHFGQNYYQKTMIFFEGTQTDYIEFSPSHKEKKKIRSSKVTESGYQIKRTKEMLGADHRNETETEKDE